MATPDMTIYSYGDVEIFRQVLSGVSMLFNSTTPSTAMLADGQNRFGYGGVMKVGLLVGLASILFQGLMKRELNFAPIFVVLILYTGMFAVKTNVNIVDSINGGASASAVVDEVPIGIAVPASFISTLTHKATEKMEAAFKAPNLAGDYVSFYQDGFLQPLKILAKLQDVNPCQGEDAALLCQSIQTFARYCRAGQPRSESGHEIPNTLRFDKFINASNWLDMFADDNVPYAYTVYFDSANPPPVGKPTTCKSAALEISSKISSFASSTPLLGMENISETILATSSFGFTGANTNPLGSIQKFADMMRSGTASIDAADLTGKLVYYQVVRDAMEKGYTNSREAAAIADITTSARQRNSNAATDASVFVQSMIPAMNLLTLLFYASTPVLAMMIALSGAQGFQIVPKYLGFGIWSQSWVPPAAIINSYMLQKTAAEIASIKCGRGGTLSGYSCLTPDMYYDFYQRIETAIGVGSTMLSMTPSITLALLGAGAYGLTKMGLGAGAATVTTNSTGGPALSTDVFNSAHSVAQLQSMGLSSVGAAASGSAGLGSGGGLLSSYQRTSAPVLEGGSALQSSKAVLGQLTSAAQTSEAAAIKSGASWLQAVQDSSRSGIGTNHSWDAYQGSEAGRGHNVSGRTGTDNRSGSTFSSSDSKRDGQASRQESTAQIKGTAGDILKTLGLAAVAGGMVAKSGVVATAVGAAGRGAMATGHPAAMVAGVLAIGAASMLGGSKSETESKAQEMLVQSGMTKDQAKAMVSSLTETTDAFSKMSAGERESIMRNASSELQKTGIDTQQFSHMLEQMQQAQTSRTAADSVSKQVQQTESAASRWSANVADMGQVASIRSGNAASMALNLDTMASRVGGEQARATFESLTQSYASNGYGNPVTARAMAAHEMFRSSDRGAQATGAAVLAEIGRTSGMMDGATHSLFSGLAGQHARLDQAVTQIQTQVGNVAASAEQMLGSNTTAIGQQRSAIGTELQSRHGNAATAVAQAPVQATAMAGHGEQLRSSGVIDANNLYGNAPATASGSAGQASRETGAAPQVREVQTLAGIQPASTPSPTSHSQGSGSSSIPAGQASRETGTAPQAREVQTSAGIQPTSTPSPTSYSQGSGSSSISVGQGPRETGAASDVSTNSSGEMAGAGISGDNGQHWTQQIGWIQAPQATSTIPVTDSQKSKEPSLPPGISIQKAGRKEK